MQDAQGFRRLPERRLQTFGSCSGIGLDSIVKNVIQSSTLWLLREDVDHVA